jgi:hypothetical protein
LADSKFAVMTFFYWIIVYQIGYQKKRTVNFLKKFLFFQDFLADSKFAVMTFFYWIIVYQIGYQKKWTVNFFKKFFIFSRFFG